MIPFFEDIRSIFDGIELGVGKLYRDGNAIWRVLIFVLFIPFVVIYYAITRTVGLIYKITRKLLLFLLSPFRVIKYHYLGFFIWIGFTLFGGLMGVIVNIMRNMWFVESDYGFRESLSLEMINGTFYTYSIAIVAAVLCSVFTLFSEAKKEELNFRGQQIVIVSISIFIILFGGIFYALSKSSSPISPLSSDSLKAYMDWQQLVVFTLSVALSIYSFCVVRLNEHKEEFGDLIDSNSKDDEVLKNVELKNYIQDES